MRNVCNYLGLALWLAVLLAFGAALAQPSRTAIGDLPTFQQGLEISGVVVGVMGNTFALEDATGTVLVDAGPPWWHALELRLGETLSVLGRPKDGGFEAISISRADGSVLQIRSSMGPPPWAGPPWSRQWPPNAGPAGMTPPVTPPASPGRP